MTHKYSEVVKTQKFQPLPFKMLGLSCFTQSINKYAVTFRYILSNWERMAQTWAARQICNESEENNALRDFQWGADRACNFLCVCFLKGLSTHTFHITHTFCIFHALRCKLSTELITTVLYSRPQGDMLFIYSLNASISAVFPNISHHLIVKCCFIDAAAGLFFYLLLSGHKTVSRPVSESWVDRCRGVSVMPPCSEKEKPSGNFSRTGVL